MADSRSPSRHLKIYQTPEDVLGELSDSTVENYIQTTTAGVLFVTCLAGDALQSRTGRNDVLMLITEVINTVFLTKEARH